MLLFKEYNFAYLHINKTGGTSVKDFLKKVLGEDSAERVGLFYNEKEDHPRIHEPLAYKVSALGPKYDSLDIITTVRNPYARWVSLYTARQRNYYEKGQRASHITETIGLTFEEWLLKFVINNINPHVLNLSLTNYLFVDHIIPPNVHIIKLEEVEMGIKKFLSGIGVETDETMFHKNKSKHGYFMNYYTDYTKGLIYKHDKYIIDRYYPEFK